MGLLHFKVFGIQELEVLPQTVQTFTGTVLRLLDAMSDFFKWSDFVLKALPAIAAVVFIVLSQSFVSRGEYLATSEKFSGRLEAVEKLLIKMESSADTDRRHDATLADHEVRLRALEHN